MDLYKELSIFKESLKEYRQLLKQLYPETPLSSKYQNLPNPFAGFAGEKERKQNELRDIIKEKRELLVENSSSLSPKITQIVGKDTINIHELSKSRIINVWDIGLRSEYDYHTAEALDACIEYTIRATGIVKKEWETINNWGPEDVLNAAKEAIIMRKVTDDKQYRKAATELPVQLFDAMQFHPKLVEVSKSLFETGNYASAILEAFKAVNILVKEKSGLKPNELRGIKDKALMAKVFDEKDPLIKLNDLISDTDISEQEGFKLLFMGATEGIRNPKAHDLIKMKDPHRTLEFLGFASMLMNKISFWKVGSL